MFEPVAPFFELFDGADEFQFYNNVDPGTHNYEKDNREQFYRFINRYFLSHPLKSPLTPLWQRGEKGGISPSEKVDSEIPSDDEVLKPEKLYAGLPENNANFFTLASKLMECLPTNSPPEGNTGELAKWQTEGRDRLRKILRLKPMKAKTSILKESSDGTLKARFYKISAGEEWSVPAVALSKSEEKPSSIAIIFADKGKAAATETVEKLVENGSVAIAVDPLFMGECTPTKDSSWKYAQMVATVGERPLGIQVGQIGAIIEKHLDYETYPALFCFGLLKQFDVQELIALCKPIKVEQVETN